MLDTLLIKTCPARSSRHLAFFLNGQPRVRTLCGEGFAVYTTDDGYIGVRLDGETRVDEYGAAHVQAVKDTAESARELQWIPVVTDDEVEAFQAEADRAELLETVAA